MIGSDSDSWLSTDCQLRCWWIVERVPNKVLMEYWLRSDWGLVWINNSLLMPLIHLICLFCYCLDGLRIKNLVKLGVIKPLLFYFSLKLLWICSYYSSKQPRFFWVPSRYLFVGKLNFLVLSRNLKNGKPSKFIRLQATNRISNLSNTVFVLISCSRVQVTICHTYSFPTWRLSLLFESPISLVPTPITNFFLCV